MANMTYYKPHMENNSLLVKRTEYSPYLICAISPTTMSATGSWITWLPRTTWNFCSCSMRLWRPRNCFSLLQSLKAVTSTTHTTESKMAAPSIHPASASPSSSAPAFADPHAAPKGQEQKAQVRRCQKDRHISTKGLYCTLTERGPLLYFD